MMAFCPEHAKWDQNPKFTPLSETTSIPTPFICGASPPPLPGFAPAIKYLHQSLLKNKSVVPSEQTSPFCFVNWQFYHVCNFKTIETSNLNENNNSFPGPFIIWTLEKQAPGKLSRSFEGWFYRLKWLKSNFVIKRQ